MERQRKDGFLRRGVYHRAGRRPDPLAPRNDGKSDSILASVDFNMFKIGCVAARAAVRHLKREPLPEKVILPAEIIDKTNYKAWLVPVDQRSCPEWTDVVR